MNSKYTKIAERLKALAEPTRLKILEMLAEEEMCACEIIDRLHLSQPAVSHHLKILRQSDIIKDRKEGKWVFYALNREGYITFLQNLPSYCNPLKISAIKSKPAANDCRPFPQEFNDNSF